MYNELISQFYFSYSQTDVYLDKLWIELLCGCECFLYIQHFDLNMILSTELEKIKKKSSFSLEWRERI